MMRLSSIYFPLVLGLAGLVLPGQQPQTGTSQKPAQAASAKQTSGSIAHKASSHKSRQRARHTSSRKGAKRRAYRPEYKENSVQVINGEATKNVVFHDEASRTISPKTKKTAATKNAPQPMKVEIVNGSATDTQYFYNNGQGETARNQAVVVGVQSSDTRIAGGNRHPVVTGVTSSSSTDAKSASNNGEPVTSQVSPRPKRPSYEPNAH